MYNTLLTLKIIERREEKKNKGKKVNENYMQEYKVFDADV